MATRTNKVHLSRIETFSNKRLSYKEKKDKKYIKSGDNNLFPQKLIELYNNSSIHNACVKSIAEAIIGGGLTASIPSALDRANRKESWNDLYNKVAIDFYLHGSFALEIIWSKDRSRIAEAYHIDFSHVRAQEKDYRGQIPGYYIYSNWSNSYSHNQSADMLELPAFNPDKREEEPNQLFVMESWAPGQEYYPLPAYVGALKVISLDMSIDDFHDSNISNGLAPSMMITTFTGGSDDDVTSIENSLRANYGGTHNAGNLIYMDCDSPDNAPKIESIPQNGADGYYIMANEMTVQKILTSHRITSPMLLGIKTEGQLGGRAEMIDAQILFQHNVIEPLQQDLLKQLDYLLSFNYEDIVLGVETKILFDDGEVDEEVITSVEVSDADDEAIQTEEII